MAKLTKGATLLALVVAATGCPSSSRSSGSLSMTTPRPSGSSKANATTAATSSATPRASAPAQPSPSPSPGAPAIALGAGEGNPLALEASGTFSLRALSNDMLELTHVDTKPAGAPLPTWDWVDSSGQLALPPASDLEVLVQGKPVAVSALGFKRRCLYAPIATRDLRVASWLTVQLAAPAPDGATVEVRNASASVVPQSMSVIVDPYRWSPAIHVSQAGYATDLHKAAKVGSFLGSAGELDVPATTFELLDATTGAVVLAGKLVARADVGWKVTPLPYQKVLEADFSSFTTPGVYRVRVPGLGVSCEFPIDDGIAAELARTYALGIYHQRCGSENALPFTRFVHGPCHTAPAEVPDLSFASTNFQLSSETADYAQWQEPTTPQLANVAASLFPFVRTAPVDVAGGHHDAGDYSKYTTNSAALIHFLAFAADSLPGAGDLDNLGIPESGDGRSDLLEEAKVEADFLAKMQDDDGGFSFLVYPRDRAYESDVLPDHGDPQVVWPKQTAVTAAATAALAQLASSPRFARAFPNEAALYLKKAQLGWTFLESALARFGREGSYQKITHYGNDWRHHDEIAWAATELYLATGDAKYHSELLAHFDPSDPNTMKWGWVRLFASYGNAIRSYAFGARSGRVSPQALDPVFLAKCEAQLVAAGDDQLAWSRATAYGTSYPDESKAFFTAGWYFSGEQAFDLAVAYQISPRNDYVDAIVENFGYETGANPVNVSFLTGIGRRRPREIVNQYALNDRRVLPPSGISVGNLASGFSWVPQYGTERADVSFPSYASTLHPIYDRYSDTWNTTTEHVTEITAKCLASTAWLMARSKLAGQPWRCVTAQIAGLPAQAKVGTTLVASLDVPGLDPTKALVVWEAAGQEPALGARGTITPTTTGDCWVEAEACWPDGRRAFATTTVTIVP